MRFDENVVQAYLKAIQDLNPIHHEIVPGQLVCEWLLKDIDWKNYKVQYKRAIVVGEELFKKVEGDIIYCMNEAEEIKIEIKKKD